MNVFDLRSQLVEDYASYISSFIQIRDKRIQDYVEEQLASGLLWPEALIQLNPAFEPGHWADELVDEGILHRVCKEVFRRKSDENPTGGNASDFTNIRKMPFGLPRAGITTCLLPALAQVNRFPTLFQLLIMF